MEDDLEGLEKEDDVDKEGGSRWTYENWGLPEPLLDLRCAAGWIPMRYESLRKHLSRHKNVYPPRYKKIRGGRRVRMLLVSEINRIRHQIIWGPGG